jgi:hypothetical protein
MKNCNLHFTRPPKRTSKIQEKPSALKRKHRALQNMKLDFFSIFVGNFCLSGPVSTDLIESGSETLITGVKSIFGIKIRWPP